MNLIAFFFKKPVENEESSSKSFLWRLNNSKPEKSRQNFGDMRISKMGIPKMGGLFRGKSH